MSWIRRLQQQTAALLGAPWGEDRGARSRRLLNMLLLGISSATVMLLVGALFSASRSATVDPEQVRRLAFGVVVTLFAIAGVSMVRRRSADLSWTLMLLVLAAMGILQLPIRFGDGYSLALYAVPLVLASLLLRPWASVILAALSGFLLVLVGWFLQPLPNLLVTASFVVLTAVAWVSVYSLERALANTTSAIQQVTESEMRYRALFDGVPVGLYRIATDGRFLDVNTALVDMLGFTSRDALLAVPADSVYVHPDDYQRWSSQLERRGILRHFQTVWQNEDGRLIDVQCTARAWRAQDGSIVYYEGSVENVTEYRRSERLLQVLNRAALSMERAQRPDQVFSIISGEFASLELRCAILICGEGQEHLNLEHACYEPEVLAAFRGATGVTPDLRNLPVDLVPPITRAIRKLEATYVPSTLAVIRDLLPPPLAPKASRFVDILSAQRAICAPLTVEDRAIGVLVVLAPHLIESDVPAMRAFAHQIAAAWHKVHLLEDLRLSVTSLSATQSQLLQAQKLESLGRLAGGIAHDFSNLLTVMQGHVQLALRRLKPDSPAYDHLAEIKTAADRAANMTGQLLAFSRREILQKHVLDLNELITDFSRMLAHTIGEHIDLKLDLSEGLPPIMADGGALERVLMNLVLNARDAMPDGGDLSIATGVVGFTDDDAPLPVDARRGEYLRIRVKDTGVGMDESAREHLFEPFFTTKEPGNGTGLGLPMAYGIVRQHEGWIEVDTVQGEGTTVDVFVPVHLGQVMKATDQDLSQLPGGTETILMAEDEPAVQRFARTVLEGLGYRVLTAGNGEEAVQEFSAHSNSIDLLLLDAVMPRMSGANAYAEIKGLKPDVPVLFITGYSEEIARLTASIGTSVEILRKPYGPKDLADRIRAILDNEQDRGRAATRKASRSTAGKSGRPQPRRTAKQSPGGQ